MEITDIGPTQLPPRGSRTLTVPAQISDSRKLSLEFSLTTDSGLSLGSPTNVTVRSECVWPDSRDRHGLCGSAPAVPGGQAASAPVPRGTGSSRRRVRTRMTGNATRDDVKSPTTSPDVTGAGPTARKTPSLLAATGSIAVATLVSRITGFLKQLAAPHRCSACECRVLVHRGQPDPEHDLRAGRSAPCSPRSWCRCWSAPNARTPTGARRSSGACSPRRSCCSAVPPSCCRGRRAAAHHPRVPRRHRQGATSLTTALSYLLLPAILFYGLSAPAHRRS